jgi:hypothetical protein
LFRRIIVAPSKRAYCPPEMEGVFKAVDSKVFWDAFVET